MRPYSSLELRPRLELLKALSDVVEAAEQVLDTPEGLTGWETLYKWLLYTELRTTGVQLSTRGCRTLATPPPAGYFPPLLGEGVAAE
jgi:hypothetical protein